jgi:hypothetical protein
MSAPNDDDCSDDSSEEESEEEDESDDQEMLDTVKKKSKSLAKLPGLKQKTIIRNPEVCRIFNQFPGPQ